MRKIRIITLLIILQNYLFAQSSTVSFISWNELLMNTKFSEKFSFHAEAQFRLINSQTGFQSQQYLFRFAPEVLVDKHLSIIPIGYAYIVNFAYEATPLPYSNNEHRIWSQLQYKHKVGRVQLQHRLRYEWRFNQAHSIDSSGNIIDDGFPNTSYRNRIRYRILTNIPIKNTTIEPKTWYIRAWNEFFLAFADEKLNPTFRIEHNLQNRLFLGGGYQIIKSLSVNLGVLYQMQMKNNGLLTEHNLGPFITIHYTPDLTTFKKK